MNIVHVIASPSPGGIESYVKDLAIEIAARGHMVRICFVESAHEAGTSLEFEEKYLTELTAHGVRFHFIGNGSRRWVWRGVNAMSRYVQENTIEIYHSHLTYGVIFGVLVSIPRVYTHHSIDMRVNRVVFTLLGNFIEQLVGISRRCSSVLSRQSKRKVVTIFNGVNLKRFSRHMRNEREVSGRFECIAVGRICVEKNYELLIDAISRVPLDKRQRLSVRIVGAGSATITAHLKERIVQKDLEGVIRLLGSRGDIPALLESSQLFLMSSSSEGLPMALIEATASGLACVVTDAGGCREIIENCRNGVVVELDNPQAFADAISGLIDDPERLAKYSANARSRSSMFAIENAASAHISMYRHLLTSRVT